MSRSRAELAPSHPPRAVADLAIEPHAAATLVQGKLTASPTTSSSSASAAGAEALPAVTAGKRTGRVRLSKAEKAGKPPRPANAWICYRSARVQELKGHTEYAKLPQADVSRIIGQLWRDETPEVRQYYELEAGRKKAEHAAKYPNYVFQPVRRPQPSHALSKKNAPARRPSAQESLSSTAGAGQPVTSYPSVLQPSVPPGDCPSTSSASPAVSHIDLPSTWNPSNELRLNGLSMLPNSYDTHFEHSASIYDWSAYHLEGGIPPTPPWTASDEACMAAFAPLDMLAPELQTLSSTFPTISTFPAIQPEHAYVTPPVSVCTSVYGEAWDAQDSPGPFGVEYLHYQ